MLAIVHTQVLPGLLLCFAMRFDENHASLGRSIGAAQSRVLLCCQRWSYFAVALIGYAGGLLVASFVADWYGMAQPALLYLVPGVLIPMVIKAFLQASTTLIILCMHKVSLIY